MQIHRWIDAKQAKKKGSTRKITRLYWLTPFYPGFLYGDFALLFGVAFIAITAFVFFYLFRIERWLEREREREPREILIKPSKYESFIFSSANILWYRELIIRYYMPRGSLLNIKLYSIFYEEFFKHPLLDWIGVLCRIENYSLWMMAE